MEKLKGNRGGGFTEVILMLWGQGRQESPALYSDMGGVLPLRKHCGGEKVSSLKP